jgi:flagellar motor switch protein FliG
MGTGNSIVITAYGRDKIVDKIAVSLFDLSSNSTYAEVNAATYCDTLSSLKLEGKSWVYAKIVSGNTQYSLEGMIPMKPFLPIKFDILLKLDDRDVQKVLEEVSLYSRDIAIALKGEKEDVQEKIISNMSEMEAVMLKDDMKDIGPVRINDVRKRQKTIIDIIRYLEETGEIVINSKGETIE